MSQRRMLWLSAAICFVFTSLGITVGVAVANHSFPDVPAASFFHDPIDQIARAGCATGFPDGTFHPTEDTNRQQFAFWLNNCGGRLAADRGTGDFVVLGDVIDELAIVEMRTGGAPVEGAGGFLFVTAEVDVETSGDQQSTWRLQRENADLGTWVTLDEDRVTVADTGGGLQPSDGTTLTAIVAGEADEVETFRVSVTRENGTPNAMLEAVVSVMYFPFNGEGEGVS